jgi:hypothetical protein
LTFPYFFGKKPLKLGVFSKGLFHRIRLASIGALWVPEAARAIPVALR